MTLSVIIKAVTLSSVTFRKATPTYLPALNIVIYSYKYFVYDPPRDRTSCALRIIDLTVEIVPAYTECLIGFMFHNSRRYFR
jgi:hypothetical protein